MVAASNQREAFLQAAENNDLEEFINFIQRHNSKADDFTFDETLQGLSRKQHEQLWSGLNQMCMSILLNSPFEPAEGTDLEAGNKDAPSTTHVCLQGIVSVALACLAMENPVMSQHMLETAVILHGVLLDLPDKASKLQYGIAKLCEKWWTSEHAGREEVITNTLMYFLVRSLQPTATVADVKSVYNLRQALSKVNIDEESSSTLRSLLEQCVTQANYLKQDKGRRFLSYLFTLSPSFIERLHKAIKTQLPVCPRSMIDLYGEVYFKAWLTATGRNVKALETRCIQDLMFHAVHASRVGSRSLASTLRQLLSYFTKQKRQQGVDKMLLTLYEPIIWRAVKVANVSVRANAAALLMDAFPLQDPDGIKEDIDALTQKQFDIIQHLLDDPCPVVRVTSIHGICRIASVYWEVIPAATLEAFLTKLVREMAFDVSTADVRAAVFKGLTCLLDNHLSHPLLRTLLSSLGDFVHDSSEKVRVAFIDLLLKVKGLRTIKFWNIVSMEHLLAQLVDDSAPVARRLVSLLFNSLQPLDRTGEVQIERCIALIQTNPAASRVFYQYAHRHMPVAVAGKFLLLLGQCILGCVRRARPTNGQPSSSSDREAGERQREEEGDSGVNAEKENEAGLAGSEDEDSLSLHDSDIMEGMLEIIAVLWIGINDQLAKPENQTTKKELVSRFSKALPEFLAPFQEGRALSAVLVIAGFVPSSSIPSFSRGCMSTLKSMSPSATPSDYGPLLECLVSWGRGSDVLELISDWMMATFKTSPKSKKKTRKVCFTEPVEPKPSLALSYLDWLLEHFPCLSALLDSCSDKLQDLTSILKRTLVSLEQRFMTPDPCSDPILDEVMVKSLEMYCRLNIHLTSKQSKEDETINGHAASGLTELIAWSDREILPMISRGAHSDTDGTTTATDMSEKKLFDLGKDVLKVVLSMSSETIMLGIADMEFQSGLADFCRLLLKTDSGLEFVPIITRLMYLMSQQSLTTHSPVHDGNDDVIWSQLLEDIVKTLARKNREDATGNSEEMQKTLTAVKPAVREVFHRCYQSWQVVPETSACRITAAVTDAVVAEVTHHVGGAGLDRCQTLAELPRLSAFLLSSISSMQSALGSFLSEIEQNAVTGVAGNIEGLVAILHVLFAISQGSKKAAGLKTCLTTVTNKLEDLQKMRTEGGEKEDADLNSNLLFHEASRLAQDITKAIGGLT